MRFGAALHDGAFWQTGIGKVIGAKLLIFGVITVVAVIHDLWLGPKAVQAAAADPESEATRKLRSGARICGRLNLMLGVVMVFLGVMIVRPGW